MSKNLAKSALVFLPAPSAMLLGIDIAQRLIWEVNPYFSSTGIASISLYTDVAKAIDFSQTFKFLKLCIGLNLKVSQISMLQSHILQLIPQWLPGLQHVLDAFQSFLFGAEA